MFDRSSDEQLEEELKRRQTRKKLDKPEPVEKPSLVQLCRLCREYIDELDEKGYVDDDMNHYIFEAAMEACFGKDVWNYINARSR